MRPRTKGILLTGALLLVVVVLVGLAAPFSHVDAICGLRVTGRLVAAGSGEAVQGARVMTLPRSNWAWDTEILELYVELSAMYRTEIDNARKGGGSPVPISYAPQCSVGVTDTEGRFSVDIGVPWSWNEVFWIFRTNSTTPPDRHGVEVLRIDAPGRGTAIVPVHGGEWIDGDPDGGDRFWATWRLGDVSVDFEDQRFGSDSR